MAIQKRLVEAVEVTENRVHVIRLKGIFDASTVSEFEKVVSYLLARNFYKVIVELGHVEFISSAGWGAFTAELRRVRENQGDVKLANMNSDVCDVFLLLELDSFIQSFDTVDEALAAFSQPVAGPEPARSSILQEIKAASQAREMAEAGARASVKPVSDFSERWRERTVAGQETYAAAYTAPTSEKVDLSASRDEHEITEPIDDKGFDRQSEYNVGNTSAEADYYGESSHLLDDEYDIVEPAEYAGNDYAEESGRTRFSLDSPNESASGLVEYAGNEYADEGEYQNFSAEDDNEPRAAEQAEYAGEGEYDSYTVEPVTEYGLAEQTEYAADEYASDDEYEGYSAESENESTMAEQAEYAGDDDASEDEYESYAAEPVGQPGAVGQTDYVGDEYDDGEYDSYSAESADEAGAVEQTEYVGDEYDDGEYESYSAESVDESGAVEQTKYTGDENVDDDEYNNYSAGPADESGVVEQIEYAGNEYADEGEYEDFSAEPNGEYGAAEEPEYAGDVYAKEAEYEESDVASYGEHGATDEAELIDDVYADETEYEYPSTEPHGEDGTAEQIENAGGVYADEAESENYSVEFDEEYAAAVEADYAGNGYIHEDEYEDTPGESDDEFSEAELAKPGVESRNDYAIAGEVGESGSDHLTPSVPATMGPEMWELLLTGVQAPVDPYMLEKSAARLAEKEKPQEFVAPETTKLFSSRPSEKDSFTGAEKENSAPDTSSDADNVSDEFVELGVAPDLGFAGHEPFVDEHGRPEADSAPASAKVDFAHDPASASPFGDDDDEFEEFETQDIRDPWILDEIDTLPEEYEMEEGLVDQDTPSFSATELLSYDLELDASFIPLPDAANELWDVEPAGESPTRFEALFKGDTEDTFDHSRGLPTSEAPEEARAESGSVLQPEAHTMLPGEDQQGDFSVPTFLGDDLSTRGEDSFDTLEKLEKKKAARTKKNKPQENFLAQPAHDELAARAEKPPSSYVKNGNNEAGQGYQPDGAFPKIPSSDNVEEIVRAVVATHPEFGAAMICKFIEDRFEPPVLISRSTVYRFLREADLNTREKRQEYADQLFDPSVLAEAI